MGTLAINGKALAWKDILPAVHGPITVTLTASAIRQMARSRATVERHLADDAPSYGINTGFGIFARKKISREHLIDLQRNLIKSHCAGVGAPLPDPVVRLMLLLKLHGLALGYSGVRPRLAEIMARWLCADCLPVIPSQGSVGASGDLAPLAHMTLAMQGHGNVRCQGKAMRATTAIKRYRLPRLALEAKEGLGLINGTQAMLALGITTSVLAREILTHADIAGALSIEGLFGSKEPFAARMHRVRPHPGAKQTAAVLRRLLARSEINASHQGCERVQDPYALRCIPAVHGVVWETLTSVEATLLREVNSVTDNPIVFPEIDDIHSGGNFHGAPLALAMDTLAIALTTLSAMSERRIEQLINPKAHELPVKGLVLDPGLHSGFMVPHTTAASLVSENKTLAHPASVDTIPTWAGQEDHVSMGMWGARKAQMVARNVLYVVAIELLAAAQAIDLHPTRLRAGHGAQAAYEAIRRVIPMLRRDRVMTPDINTMAALVEDGSIRLAVERKLGGVSQWARPR